MRKVIIIFLIVSIFFPYIVLAQDVETDNINLEGFDFEEVSDISLDIGDTINFFKEAKSLGSKIYSLVSKIWKTASSFIENVIGLTLEEIFVGLINAVIGIVKTMVVFLNEVL
jgi:hypothetical protein